MSGLVTVNLKRDWGSIQAGATIKVAVVAAQFLVHHKYAEVLDRDRCPECVAELTEQEGCRTCLQCGWSKCD